jgi:signal transduction histidine kinase
VKGGDSGRPPRRGRSLIWLIAGAFLLMAVLGTLAQGLLATSVLRPIETREARSRAELLASRFETEIARMPARDPLAIGALMARLRTESGLRFTPMLYRGGDGLVVIDPPDRAAEILASLEGGAPSRGVEPRSTLEPRTPAGTPRPSVAPNSATRPEPATPSDGRGPRRYETLARRALTRDGVGAGEIVVLRPVRNRAAWPFTSRALLLSAPIALLISLLLGLLMVRLLVRRLRALETLATRVAEGDLSVRVEDRSGDEIGRLAERLNRMTESLAEARDRLEAHEIQRRQLFADITHELATPLTSIRGYTETLLDPKVSVSDEERGRYLGHMLAESRRLDRLIRDLFDLARLEAGATPLEIERLDWMALCRHTADRFEPRFRAAGLGLSWRGTSSEAWIEADGHRMEQVLENLLANALRYVPAGGHVELAIESVGSTAEPRYRMTIDDDGPGLSGEDLPHLFERFYRSPAARGHLAKNESGGSGLGLAIVREIVQRHGGAVSAQSRAPHGLSIAVEMPATRRPARAA